MKELKKIKDLTKMSSNSANYFPNFLVWQQSQSSKKQAEKLQESGIQKPY